MRHSIVVRHLSEGGDEGSGVDGEVAGRRPSKQIKVGGWRGRDGCTTFC